MVQRPHLIFVLALALAPACGPAQPEAAAAESAAEAPLILIDQALLADVLGEAVEVTGDRISADGLLVRLAFEPLIRQTGPVQLQLVQSTGYRLLGVVEGSPLWQLGLRDGDVLTRLDGEPIVGREHELRSRWERRPSSAELGYLRGDQTKTLSLRIRSGAAWRSTEVVSTVVTRPPVDIEPAPEFDPNVRCNPGTPPNVIARCEIDRSAMDRLRADPSGIVKQVRVVPRTQDGETRGFKLYGIRASSLPALLGLQNGDVLVAVDDLALTGVDSAMEAFTRLSDRSKFKLTIERNGELEQLDIAIVDVAK